MIGDCTPMLGMLIETGNRPNRVASEGVVGVVGLVGVTAGDVERGVERDGDLVLGVIRPEADAGGCGGGVARFA
jgi:hypothetical protein